MKLINKNIVNSKTGNFYYYNESTGEFNIISNTNNWLPKTETTEQILDRINITEIEQYLRKKKLNNIKNNQ